MNTLTLQFFTYYIISLIIFTYKTINLLQGNYSDIFTQQILIILSFISTVIFSYAFLKTYNNN